MVRFTPSRELPEKLVLSKQPFNVPPLKAAPLRPAPPKTSPLASTDMFEKSMLTTVFASLLVTSMPVKPLSEIELMLAPDKLSVAPPETFKKAPKRVLLSIVEASSEMLATVFAPPNVPTNPVPPLVLIELAFDIKKSRRPPANASNTAPSAPLLSATVESSVTSAVEPAPVTLPLKALRVLLDKSLATKPAVSVPPCSTSKSKPICCVAFGRLLTIVTALNARFTVEPPAPNTSTFATTPLPVPAVWPLSEIDNVSKLAKNCVPLVTFNSMPFPPLRFTFVWLIRRGWELVRASELPGEPFKSNRTPSPFVVRPLSSSGLLSKTPKMSEPPVAVTNTPLSKLPVIGVSRKFRFTKPVLLITPKIPLPAPVV